METKGRPERSHSRNIWSSQARSSSSSQLEEEEEDGY